jgi:sigma-E factor negative regulatory protein RseB
MNHALERVQFDGTLVYLHGNDLSALRVSHRLDNGTPGESLLSLTGPVRALSRHAEGVTCMLPDAAPLTMPRPPAHPGLIASSSMDFARLAQHYRIASIGMFRVAGRDTDVVAVTARDAHRYGYRFYVDHASGLPLKVDLLDTSGEPIQQVMFTDVTIGPAPAAATIESTSAPSSPTAEAEDRSRGDHAWGLTRLPDGFRLISRDTYPASDGGTVHHLVASDGLASFSVYIEPPSDGALQGESSLGAVSAAGGRVGEHQVTVVGEVPPATVRLVLEHVEVP